MKIRVKTNPKRVNGKTKFITCLSLMLCGCSVFATQYVIPGGAGDSTGESWENAHADVQSAVDAALFAAYAMCRAPESVIHYG